MSAHRFLPGRDPGRCARCGCADSETVHSGGSAAEIITAGQIEQEAAMLASMAISVRNGHLKAWRDEYGRIQFAMTEAGRELVRGLGPRSAPGRA